MKKVKNNAFGMKEKLLVEKKAGAIICSVSLRVGHMLIFFITVCG